MSRFLQVSSTALIFLTALNLQADAPPATVRIQSSGVDVEGLPTFRLEWNAAPNTTYFVQSGSFGDTAGLNGNDMVWTTIDIIRPEGVLGAYQLRAKRSEAENTIGGRSAFFRLVLPSTVISSVEPASFAPGVPVTAYVLGQCFESNDVVRVDGVEVSGVIYVNHNLLQVHLPSLSAGQHLVELVRGDVVLSSFTWAGADAVTNPELVLQGPPGRPLARPTGILREAAQVLYAEEGIEEMTTGGGVDDDCDGHVDETNPDEFRSGAGGGVVPFSGEVQMCELDLVIPGRGLDFIWARTYHSRIGRTGTSMNGWTFSYDVRLQPYGGGIVIHNGTGRADTFTAGTNGVYTCPEFFSEGTLTGGVFRLTFADTGYWEFNPIDPSSPEATLARIVDRNGNTISLNYDTSGRLTQIVDDLSRTNTVAYDTAGRLTSVTDFSGRTVRYEYDGNGDLTACVSPPVIGTPNGNDFPGGKTKRYTYTSGFPFALNRQNHLLLSCVDALGQTTAQFSYDLSLASSPSYLRCISVQNWTNPPTRFSYLPQTPTPANQFATMRCVVNDPVGNVAAISTDARGRCVKLEEFTGRATPGTPVTNPASLPIPKLRLDDPASYETRWQWNNDSLCTSEISPGGQQVQCVYESDFDKSTRARKRADCRVVREIASSPVMWTATAWRT